MTEPKYLTGDKASIDEFLDSASSSTVMVGFGPSVIPAKTPIADCMRRIGVLWSGEQMFPRIPETIDALRKKGKQLVFVTNNSTKSRADYKKKFDKLGITAYEEEVFGSSYSAAIYISRILKLQAPKNKVYVLGESGVEQELASENIRYCGGTDKSLQREMTADDYTNIASGKALDDEVAIVLTGLDFHPSYLKYSLGMAYLRRGAKFLATNIDSTLPNAGSLFPGAGSTSAPLIQATGQEPLALGKPSQAMMEAIEGKFQFDRKRTCMVGDRLNTDIQFGIEGGLGGTLCVLTGVSQKEEFLGKGAAVVPSHYADQLGDLLG